jgi:LPS-assembly lipoprotein
MMKPMPRTLPIAAALSLAALGLGGCGFTPLYAAPGVTPKLASIEVSRPDGRTGFLMGQYLDDDLAKNRVAPPVYRLLLKTNEVRIPRGVRVDNVASRYEVDLNTTYTLVEIATRKVVTAGLVKVNVTYDSADQPYAGVAAELDGQERAAEQAAQRIRLELATYFASPRPTPDLTAEQLAADASLATYSERLQPATVQSPRERALGQPSSQSAGPDFFGQPLRGTTPDTSGIGPQVTPDAAGDGPLADPYAPKIDPLPDPAANLAPGQR